MMVCGVDEAGTGAWCGGFTVCAVLAPPDWTLPGLNDSKKLSPLKRAALYDQILESSPFVISFLEWVSVEGLDREGVGRSRIMAFRRAIKRAMAVDAGARIIVDGDFQLYGIDHESYPKADATYPAVMAASVVAKVERDRWMETEADSLYPQYKIIDHKGYGTKAHQAALAEYGPSPIHRMSFGPVARAVKPVAALIPTDVEDTFDY